VAKMSHFLKIVLHSSFILIDKNSYTQNSLHFYNVESHLTH